MAGAMREAVLAALFQQQDQKFQAFNDRIVNNQTGNPSIGVRTPALRKICRELAGGAYGEFSAYFDELDALTKEADTFAKLYQEEHMLYGMLIGTAKMSPEERCRRMESWIPRVLSWADCDSAVGTWKFVEKDPDGWYPYWLKLIETYRGKFGSSALDGGCAGATQGKDTLLITRTRSGQKTCAVREAKKAMGTDNRFREFSLRVPLVVLLEYYIGDAYIDRLLETYGQNYSDAYYVRMAQAWALSICFVKCRDKTLEFLRHDQLDTWTHNKAIQKCRESLRVSAEDKALLQRLKR